MREVRRVCATELMPINLDKPPLTTNDIAVLLGVSRRYLLGTSRRSGYRLFQIKKRSGGIRLIAAPSEQRKHLQKKLLTLLYSVYSGRTPVHGFVPGRSIRTNAACHADRKHVLNLDLVEFFPTIHFGRVRGMFMARPYFFGKEAATVLAQLVCFNGALPQGAPTSPIVANMVCAQMDSELKALAIKHRCRYTRYADDITFSSTVRDFPKGMAFFGESSTKLYLGDELGTVIKKHGFAINERKLRLLHRTTRQEVTGLTANQFPNTKRRFVRQIRAMLHAWRKFGEHAAQNHFCTHFDHRTRLKTPKFSDVVRGKIDFLGQIRGKQDALYWRLLRQWSELAGEELPPPPLFIQPDIQKLKLGVWVVETENSQGTAFFVKDVGFVTCYHVIDGAHTIEVYDSLDPLETRYPLIVNAYDETFDIAILGGQISSVTTFHIGDDSAVKQSDRITLLGFPKRQHMADVAIIEGKVVNHFTYMKHHRRYAISAPVLEGNSGGPILNGSNQVIGIAAKGAGVEPNAFVPISNLFRI
jgi:RNA-directed DNA polymerase